MLTRDARGAAILGGVRLGDLFDPTPAGAGILTPAFVYDVDAMVAAVRDLGRGFGGQRHLIAYAVKANSAGVVVRALAEAGCGADVVSGGELRLALACGVSPERIVFSGVAKSDAEIDHAIATGPAGILALQIESVEEIARVDARAAAAGRRARVSLRFKPGILADTHAHVATGHDEAKFGVAQADLPAAFDALAGARNVELVGVGCHIGSQLMRTTEYLVAADVLLEVARSWESAHGRLELIDFGGGFGIDYGGSAPPARPSEFAEAIAARLARSGLAAATAVVEPGRALVGAQGVLCSTVVMAKRSGDRRWLFIDAGMNDLLRPALYAAFHRIEPLDEAPAGAAGRPWRVAGPVCESSDDFGEHHFKDPPPARVVIRDAGAYGYTMASEYNGRPLAAEVFLRGGKIAAVSTARSVEAWIAHRVAALPSD